MKFPAKMQLRTLADSKTSMGFNFNRIKTQILFITLCSQIVESNVYEQVRNIAVLARFEYARHKLHIEHKMLLTKAISRSGQVPSRFATYVSNSKNYTAAKEFAVRRKLK